MAPHLQQAKPALVVVLLASLLAAGNALAQPKVLKGAITTRDGLTLYTFDNDIAGSGKSSCNGACSGIFPPYGAGAKDVAQGDFSIVVRDDGSRQWAYKGKPLYVWFDDKKPGQAGGDGMNHKVWHVARP
jgi:predicted lipoprotein with Yx(FWY)xxD motif